MMRRPRPLTLAAVVAVAAVSLLAAGCGGGSAGGVSRTTTAQNGRLAAALSLARCLRSHGIPNWPDPTSDGGFDKAKLVQLGVSGSRVRALEDGACNIPIPSGRPQGQTITAADRTDYLKGAACMRSHGFPAFPDPTFPNNNVTLDIPSSINQDSSRYNSAATICTKLIPAGLPYSGSNTR